MTRSFRLDKQDEQNLNFVLKKTGIQSVTDLFRKLLRDEVKRQFFIDKLQPNLAFDLSKSQLLWPENPH